MTNSQIDLLVQGVRVIELLSILTIVASALPRWWRTRDRSSLWVIVGFGVLAHILAVAFLPDAVVPTWYSRLSLAGFLVFPYALVRFAQGMCAVKRPWVWIATAMVVVEVALTLVLIPLGEDAPSAALTTWLVVALTGWTGQSLIAGCGLIVAARGHVTVVRRRMRMLGAGALVVAGSLIYSALASRTPTSTLVTTALGLAGIILFLLSFVLPKALRVLWRQPELEALGRAQVALLGATTPTGVAQTLVPVLVRVVGGSGAVMLDRSGTVLGARDMSAHDVDEVSARSQTREGADPDELATELTPGLFVLGTRRAFLGVQASSFSPFIGSSELRLLHHIGYLADLALERLEFFEQDRQARRQLEVARDEAMAASRLKSQFLANVSHEIRTPMNGVIGMASLLLGTRLDPHQREFAETVRTSANALLTVIDDILDFSKIEAGRLDLESIDVDLSAVVDEAAGLLSVQAQGKDLELTCWTDPFMPPLVRGDPVRVRQILLNLLANAVKFTPAGEVELSAHVVDRAGADGEVIVEFVVRDTGIGMDAETLERVFDGFSQADASTTRHYGGTGLCLSISRQLTELMGGTLTGSSSPGRGSTFTVRLPFTASDSSTHERALADLTGVRVLVVDDNATNRRVLLGMLAAAHALPASAASAPEGLDVLRAAADAGAPYHALLVDLNMPDMDGLTMSRMVRADPRLARTTVLLLTSSARITATEGHEAGIDGSLTKPIRQGQLLAMLHERVRPGERSASVPSPRSRGGEPALGRLLLAEDNPINQKVAVYMLRQLGYEVDVVPDGQAALDALARARYDAVLMDCQMPVLDGYAATREFRSREAPGEHTPVIALTASAMAADRERCLEAGMDDYLSKPVWEEHLAAVLRRLVRHPRPPRRTDDTARGGAAPVALRRELVETYVAHNAPRVDRLLDRLRDDDPDEVLSLAHELHSSSTVVGAFHLAELLREVEEVARTRPGDLHDLADRLHAEHQRVLAELTALRP